MYKHSGRICINIYARILRDIYARTHACDIGGECKRKRKICVCVFCCVCSVPINTQARTQPGRTAQTDERIQLTPPPLLRGSRRRQPDDVDACDCAAATLEIALTCTHAALIDLFQLGGGGGTAAVGDIDIVVYA